MGGDDTAISDATTDIFFEAAFFAPGDIIGKARQLGMHTDASHRFERGVDPLGQQAAVDRATALLIDIAGGKPGKACHAVNRSALPKQKAVTLQAEELPRILGIKIPGPKVKDILTRLGMSVSGNAKKLTVTPPSWRFDISGQHDLVEEVGRCYGYEHIPPNPPAAQARTGSHPETTVPVNRLKQVLTAEGYFEAISYSFVAPALQRMVLDNKPGIALANPLAENMSEMRQSLLPGLLTSVVRNANRQEDRIRLFECGTVFAKKARKRDEQSRIAGAVSGNQFPRQWGIEDRPVDFFDMKGNVELLVSLGANTDKVVFTSYSHPAFHPGQCAEVKIGKSSAGFVGRLHPVIQQKLDLDQAVYLFELDLSRLVHAPLPAYQSISRFPAIQRDLAVVVDDETEASELLSTIRENAGPDLKSLELFDIYQGERVEKNKKSFAFSLTFQSESSSLKAADIEDITSKIITALEASKGAQLRS